MDAERGRLRALVRGDVQGVGFRWWAREQAEELGLSGSASNLPDGRVEVVAEGSREALTGLLARLEGEPGGRPGTVDGVEARWEPASGGERGFRVR